MSDETSVQDEACNLRVLNREARRLERIRLADVHVLPRPQETEDDYEPDPKQAA